MNKILVVLCLLIVAFPVRGEPNSSTALPAPVIDIVHIQPFTLSEGFKHTWSRKQAQFTSGTIAVLKVNPELVVPRQTAEPVLYVGNQAVQRLNQADKSGHLIVLISGDIDLTRAPVWFGTPSLPERATEKTIGVERASAEKANIKPFAENKIRNLTKTQIHAKNLPALLREYVAALVLEYSPQESHLADTWQLPVVGEK